MSSPDAPNPASVRASQWSAPRAVDDLDVVFGTVAMTLMPPYGSELRAWAKTPEARPWIKFQHDWFFFGLAPGTVFNCKAGVDQKIALRQLRAVQSSFEPKHEHKEAGVAYLASLFFDSVTYERKQRGSSDDRT